MDSGAKRDWSWLPQHMPGVARLIREKKAKLGDAHVNLCWRHGVVNGEPGWFYAAEGALAVGTPWHEVLDIACMQVTPTQALLILRDEDKAHG